MNGFAQRLFLTEAKGNSKMVYYAMENHPTVLDELKQEFEEKILSYKPLLCTPLVQN